MPPLPKKRMVRNRDAMSFVENALSSRSELFKKLMDPRRDIDDECGHPKYIEEKDYKDLYEREGIAARVVEVLPRECWQVQPSVVDKGDAENSSVFEQAILDLGKNLRGKSWYRTSEGNPLWEHMKRLDELAGIGYYGVMLLGFNDLAEGESLDKPVDKKSNLEILFLRTFDSSMVTIKSRETDQTSPRYGHPKMYTINFEDITQTETSIKTMSVDSHDVHWSRIIHVADNLGVSEIFGPPRMQSVFNRLLDLNKLYGGSAEMYWRGAFPGLSIESHPQLGGDVEVSDELKDDLENYMNGLQRYLAVTGMSAKSLSPQVVDPTAQIDVQITAICIRLGIPKRKFMGTERGELASSMDDDEWNDKLKARQSNFITPRIIIPFIDRLIDLGVLPEPQDGYQIEWPDIHNLSDQIKSEILKNRVTAMAAYVQGDVESVMSLTDFYIRELNYSPEDTQAIIENLGELDDDEDGSHTHEDSEEDLRESGEESIQDPQEEAD